MRKIEVIELVKDYLAGGDAPDDVKGRYHDEILSNHLSTAFKRMVFDTWLEAKMHSDYSLLDLWARIETLDLNDDDTEGEQVAYLPYPPVQLPNAMGILSVNPVQDTLPLLPIRTVTFAYRETNHNSVFADLEVGQVSTKPYFYLELGFGTGVNKDIHTMRLGNVPDNCNQVAVKMIVPWEVIDDYDPMAVPAGKEDLMVRSVIDLLRGKPPEDVVNDNIANQT